MADSDYEFEGDDGSDDEYVGTKSSSSTRVQAPGKRRTQEKEKPRKLAWERSEAVAHEVSTIEEADDGTIEQSVQEREEDRKRKR